MPCSRIPQDAYGNYDAADSPAAGGSEIHRNLRRQAMTA
jgi:hypothetical protein